MRVTIHRFCVRYAIQAITFSEDTGVTADAHIINVHLHFAPATTMRSGSTVTFKLQDAQARLCRGVDAIDADGQIHIRAAAEMPTAADLQAFFTAIESRVAKIQYEQAIQSIKFLGSTFCLNQKSNFKVTADDDGKLSIELQCGDAAPQSAAVSASALLDGLYDGSITLVERSGQSD